MASLFRGELAEQDVNDESAPTLLEGYQPQKASPYGKKKRSK